MPRVQPSVFNDVLPWKVRRRSCSVTLSQPHSDFLKLPEWLWAHLVIQVRTITQRLGHRDTGYFHIPDGCYFNYTELLDFVLWIYMFSLPLWNTTERGGGILGRLFFCTEYLILGPWVCAKEWKNHGRVHCNLVGPRHLILKTRTKV